jgi:spermidine synthase
MSEVTFSEEGGLRYLHFGSPWVQGAMRLSSPTSLELSYIQDMMSWMLFLDPPKQITQLGIGAGSLTKYCLSKCAPSQVVVVELSDTVILAAQMWFHVPAHARLEIVHQDAKKYLEDMPALTLPNVLQVDIYDETARGPVFDSLDFYENCLRFMGGYEKTPTVGIAVFNFFGLPHFIKSRERLAKVFGGRIVCLSPCAEGNVVVLAFCGPQSKFSLAAIKIRADRLEKAWKLPAARWVKAINQPVNHWMLD